MNLLIGFLLFLGSHSFQGTETHSQEKYEAPQEKNEIPQRDPEWFNEG